MLELDHLSKRYGDRLALDDVTFTVGAGRLTGFVGGNGAGKTTTMRIALGVLAADAGTVSIDGAPVTSRRPSPLRYMPEERGLYPKMKVLEQTVYLARLHAGRRPPHAATPPSCSNASARRTPRRHRRVALARQPAARADRGRSRAQARGARARRAFSGARPDGGRRRAVRARRRAAGGAPVLFSSHQLDVVERICDDLVIIAAGRIRAAGSREALRAEHGTDRWELLTSGDAGWVRSIPGIEVVSFDGGWALFEAETDAARRQCSKPPCRAATS